MNTIWRVGLCLAGWCLTGGSQTSYSQSAQLAGEKQGSLPAFEVASLKLTPTELAEQVSVRKCENGRLTMRKSSLIGIISWAFDVKSWDMVVPSWAIEHEGQTTYDIDAEADGPAPQQQVKLMLQRLLAERLQLAAHHEMKEGVHRVLRVAKGGPKLQEAGAAVPGTPKVRIDRANSRIICTGAGIDELLFFLNVTGIDGAIYNGTGLSGKYDFTLDYGKYLEDSDPAHRLNALQRARIDALRVLGLEVVEARIPVDTLVIDHVEKLPIAN